MTDLFEQITPTPEITRRQVAEVALPVPLEQTFDYLLPWEWTGQAAVGTRVKVPFGRSRELVGLVTGLRDVDVDGTGRPVLLPDVSGDPAETDPPAGPAPVLKTVLACLDEQPVVDPDQFRLLEWASRYYHYPLGEVIFAGLPSLVRQGRPLDVLNCFWRKRPEGCRKEIARAPKLQQALHLLELHDKRGAPESVLTLMGATRKQLQSLEQRGLAESFEVRENLGQAPWHLASLPLHANPDQQTAITVVQNSLGQYAGFLLDGQTGSGKTEVYLQAIEKVLERGEQALVLVPEIGLTPQTIGRFRSRFQTEIVTFHSGMTELQRMQAWRSAHSGHARIVIGTRSAVFASMPNLGLIIIDEEHDLSFKQQDSFRYNARDVALRRGQIAGCPVLLGSATPSIESYYLVQKEKLRHLTLTERHSVHPPVMHVVDTRVDKKSSGFSRPLMRAMQEALKKGEQVLVFLNRRGYAPILQCQSCGWQANCRQCDAHLTVHTVPHWHLRCHYCDARQGMLQVCPKCQDSSLTTIGHGTVRAEEHLKSLFPDYPVLRVDRDSVGRVTAWDEIYEQIGRDEPAILLGTQMLAKGHHFPNVTVAAILDADGGLFSADFRAIERTAQLITQVAGRAGRGHAQGHIYIQTMQPDHHYLQTLVREGYRPLALSLLAERQQLMLPPFRHSVLLRADSTDSQRAGEVLGELVARLKQHAPSGQLEIWGPIPAPMEKKAGWFRQHAFMMSNDRIFLHQLLGQYWKSLVQQPRYRGVRLSLDIDPMEFS